VFPKINVVYLVIVFLSVILPMLLLSSELKRNLMIAQKLTISSDALMDATGLDNLLINIDFFGLGN
jgi:hypothetical protein